MTVKSKAERVADYLKMISDPEELLDSLPSDAMLESGLESTGFESSGGLATHDKVLSGLEKIARGFDPSEEEAGQLEAIILPGKRPAAFVQNGTYVISDKLWQHLEKPEFKTQIEAAIPSIGRVELPDNPSIPFGGTGFIVGDGLMMTNRHVASLFASGLGTRVQFKPDESAAIDFKREYGSADSLSIRVDKVLMIHPYWDMAILKVSGLPKSVKPLNLTVQTPEELSKRDVVAIGYPAFDPRNNFEEQKRIFGEVYNVKRLLPGKLRGRQDYPSFGKTVSAMAHDCTTLGGSSGSALIDVKTGQVVGLHFAGAYLEANYSVPTYELARDNRVVQAGLNFKGSVTPTTDWAAYWTAADRFGREFAGDISQGDPKPATIVNGGATVTSGPAANGGQGVTFTIPLNVTVSLSNPVAPVLTGPASANDDAVEKVPLIYPDLQKRKGYAPDFLKLSGDVIVPMPELTAKGLKLAAKLEDGTPHLKYHKFTVVVHKQRRLALFTAANVDWRKQSREVNGKKPSRKELNGFEQDTSEDWVTDPRIPFDHQLPDYFYAKDGGAFDKGHLVRRDDIAWGKTFEEMQKGNGDTFHTTNCSPQTARFNQSKFKDFNWGELEKMVEKQTSAEKVCTISGPVLDPEDQFFHGLVKSRVEVSIQIPSRFWKIIIASEGGKPKAFGFVLEQDLTELDLHEELIVPDAWKKFMRPISDIELLLNGLAHFGPLKKWDQYGAVMGGDDGVDGGGGAIPRDTNESPLECETAPAQKPEEEPHTYPVWFGTNRKPSADGKTFGNERSSFITRGRVMVRIPPSRPFGTIGTTWWERLKRWELEDDHVRIREVKLLDQETFLRQLRSEMAESEKSGDEPHALLFLHGFNVSFEEAAVRAAQIGFDLKVTGATAFFSWPSQGSKFKYIVDEATMEGSESAITEFLVDFTQNCGAKKVHLIAHSMGNRGLLRAIQRISGDTKLHGKVRFGQIILAAPDVDRDLFLDLARIYPSFSDRTTLYSSKRDFAVFVSSVLHASPRVGYFEPYTIMKHIDSVAVPHFNVDLLGHSEFSGAGAILNDMHDLTRHNTAPVGRIRIDPAESQGQKFWQMKK